jgi:hypothetical protein
MLDGRYRSLALRFCCLVVYFDRRFVIDDNEIDMGYVRSSFLYSIKSDQLRCILDSQTIVKYLLRFVSLSCVRNEFD